MSDPPLRIEVVSDTVCPWCFVGKHQLRKALEQFPDLTVELVWHPFFLDPTVPPEGLPAREYMQSKFGAEGTRRLSSRLRSAAEQVGLELNLSKQQVRPHTLDSHRVIHWAHASGVQNEVVEALFRAYFVRGENIGDRDLLAAIAGAHGMDEEEVRTRLELDDDAELVTQQAREQRERGITGVPCFFIDGFPVPGAQDAELFGHVLRRVLTKRQERSR